MTTLKTALLAASALTLMSGAALAQANQAYTSQDGSNNTALILQGGVGSNVAGSTIDAVTQTGADNEIDINQTNTSTSSARTNFVGAGSAGTSNGVDQTGDDNVLSITQNGANNALFQVQQSGDGNTVNASQSDSVNRITAIDQSGDDNQASVTQSGGQNTVGRSFTRAQSTTFSGVGQTGNDNILVLNQNGSGNTTRAVTQNGDGNNASLSIVGSGNGAQGISGTAAQGTTGTFSGGFAGGVGYDSRFIVAGTEQSTVSQTDGSTLTFTISGNDNLYGFNQTGASVATGSVTGSDNQFSVGQNGRTFASLTINGSSNDIGLNQTTSAAAAAQANATVSVDGSGNRLGVAQSQNGNATSNLTVNITGDLNNATALGGFTGDAGSIFFNRTPGLIEQLGSNNNITLNVGQAGSPSDSNRFSLRQSSAGNTITGTISGNLNQAAISQSGGDTATFTQVGNGNNLGVRQ